MTNKQKYPAMYEAEIHNISKEYAEKFMAEVGPVLISEQFCSGAYRVNCHAQFPTPEAALEWAREARKVDHGNTSVYVGCSVFGLDGDYENCYYLDLERQDDSFVLTADDFELRTIIHLDEVDIQNGEEIRQLWREVML